MTDKPNLLRHLGERRIRRYAAHEHSPKSVRSPFHGTSADHLAEALGLSAALIAQMEAAPAARATIQPVDFNQASNPLRPATLDQMIGQPRLKPLLRRLIDSAHTSGRRLDHLLLVGASGTGKTTTATVIARELGVRCFALKAPVDVGTLEALRESAQSGDVILIDEIHQMVHGDRRGITEACDPESLYLLLEDGILATPRGHLPFPDVTFVGATTDVGLLPEPLSNRFPLQPRLQPYTENEMAQLAEANATALGLTLDPDVAGVFGSACRLNPRQANSYLRATRALTPDGVVSRELATEVITDLSSTTLDGLTESMQTVLKFLYQRCARTRRDETVYSASVNTLATACGHGRDTKAISLLVEPWLLQRGLLEVRPSGRTLTTAGVERARELLS